MKLWTKAAAAAAAGLAGAAGYFALGARQDEQRLDAMWAALEAATPQTPYDSALLESLPDAARRYLQRAIAPDAPPAAFVKLQIDGRLRPAADKPWTAFTSREILGRERGFVWRARMADTPVRGFDRYFDQTGEMCWRLFGLVPVMRAADHNVTRSAAERYAGERIFLPTSLLPGPAVRWLPDEEGSARVALDVDGREIVLTLDLTDEGDLVQVRFDRWGDRGTGDWRLEPYGVRCAAPRTFHGIRIPTRVEALWSPGTDRELLYFEGRVREASYL